MANKQKISTLVINNVLAFITPFASKRLKKAIELLLKPCCVITISDVTYDCGDEQLTVVLDPIQVSVGTLGATVDLFTDAGTPGDVVYVGTGTLSTDGKTVVIDVAIADAPVGADQIFTAKVFMPSSETNDNLGVFEIAVSEEITIPVC